MKLSKIYKQLLKEFEEVSKAAGAIIYAKDTGRILLELRSDIVDHPLTWSTFGGGAKSNESEEECCKRELGEEIGYFGEMTLKKLYVSKSPKFEYHTFLITIPHEFEIKGTKETTAGVWFNYGTWPNKLHPGLKEMLQDESVLIKLDKLK